MVIEGEDNLWITNQAISHLRRETEVLQSRVKDLECQVEMMTGANSILSTELQECKVREAALLNKIFDITGVNKQTVTHREQTTNKPINMSNRIEWPKLRVDLETKARNEYWEKKKAETDQKIEKLESELNIEAKENTNG